MVSSVAVRKNKGQLLPPILAFPYDNVPLIVHVPIEPLLREGCSRQTCNLTRTSLLATSAFLRAAKVIEDRLETILKTPRMRKLYHIFYADFCLRRKTILASSTQAILRATHGQDRNKSYDGIHRLLFRHCPCHKQRSIPQD